MRLLDSDGLDGLTVRKLGASLNVQGPALYRHFRSKEALLDAIADRLLAEVTAEPLPDLPWDQQLIAVARRLRVALLAHRDGARVVAGTFTDGPNTAMVGNAIFAVMERAGFPAERAGWSLFAISHYTLGHTIEEQAQLAITATPMWSDRVETIVDTVATDYGREALAATLRADPAQRFDYGLRLLVNSIRRDLDE